MRNSMRNVRNMNCSPHRDSTSNTFHRVKTYKRCVTQQQIFRGGPTTVDNGCNDGLNCFSFTQQSVKSTATETDRYARHTFTTHTSLDRSTTLNSMYSVQTYTCRSRPFSLGPLTAKRRYYLKKIVRTGTNETIFRAHTLKHHSTRSTFNISMN